MIKFLKGDLGARERRGACSRRHRYPTVGCKDLDVFLQTRPRATRHLLPNFGEVRREGRFGAISNRLGRVVTNKAADFD